ncbi:MAG: hypothetical protein LZ166_03635 [Thaumarchaeota archaeon]|jgi:hypothetical protein|nr:hypothetical protein [Nitrososphaerota archaeon]MCL7386606.1 hypothetical protein [Candidatus Wolframiiraptor allenii]
MTYRLRIKVGGLELELEGDREFLEARFADLSWVDALLERLGGLGRQEMIRVSHQQAAAAASFSSFVEFASHVNPEKNWEKFLTIAYYLYRQEGRDLTYEDVEKYYTQARWPMPKNVWDVMSHLIREGYMEDAGKQNDRKVFRILRKGIEHVERLMSGGGGGE